MMRSVKTQHLLIVAAVVAVLLGAGFFRSTGNWSRAEEDRAVAVVTEPARPVKTGPSRRERCKQKCAAVQKGYVYRGRHGGEPEYCGCA